MRLTFKGTGKNIKDRIKMILKLLKDDVKYILRIKSLSQKEKITQSTMGIMHLQEPIPVRVPKKFNTTLLALDKTLQSIKLIKRTKTMLDRK